MHPLTAEAMADKNERHWQTRAWHRSRHAAAKFRRERALRRIAKSKKRRKMRAKLRDSEGGDGDDDGSFDGNGVDDQDESQFNSGTTDGGVSFGEWQGSPKLSLMGGQLAGTRIFRTDWGDRLDFVDDLFGEPYSFSDDGGFQFDPATFCDMPWLAAVDYSIDPHMPNSPMFDGLEDVVELSNGCNKYQNALITVHYRPYLSLADPNSYAGPTVPSVQDGTLLDYTTEIGCEFTQIPGRYLIWASDSTPLDGDVQAGVRLPTQDFVFRWDRVADPGFDAIRTQLGTTNNDTFMDYDAGCVLFDDFKPTPMFLPSGVVLYNCILRFKIRAIPNDSGTGLGWNYSYRYNQSAMTGSWALVWDKGTKAPVFSETDFDSIFGGD